MAGKNILPFFPIALFLLLSITTVPSYSQQDISFDSGRWQIVTGKVAEFQGRLCFTGSAYVDDLSFQDGTIEVDVWLERERGYPGINFRIQSANDYENFYIRPHRSGFYSDVLQYVPSFNGIRGWQLYNGDGFTAGYDVSFGQWLHIRLEVVGSQARVYLNDDVSAALVIPVLKHGISSGTVGIESAGSAPVYFSNFRIDTTSVLAFESPPLVNTPPGMIREWELSEPYPMMNVDLEKTPGQQGIPEVGWKKVTADVTGLVDIARYWPRNGREPDCIFARTFLFSDDAKIKEFRFGYSDAISLFLNGNLIFSGTSAYQQRDPSFLGIVGLNDAVYLPLITGRNELVLLITENSGGWGFMIQDAKQIEKEDHVTELWTAEGNFRMPESVLYDPKRAMLYVSNFDQFNTGQSVPEQFISRLAPDGKILDLKWINGLHNPSGMALFNDILYVTDRKGFIRIQPDRAEVIDRTDIPGAAFLNDIAVDDHGTVYISDTRKNTVWRWQADSCTAWLTYPQVEGPNGLFIHQGRLLVGNSGDGCLKSFDLKSKAMIVIARLGSGIIDGIRSDPQGNYLVSHWEGRLFRVTPEGGVHKILDMSGPEFNLADFEYLPGTDILFIPTFYNNRVMAFKLGLE